MNCYRNGPFPDEQTCRTLIWGGMLGAGENSEFDCYGKNSALLKSIGFHGHDSMVFERSYSGCYDIKEVREVGILKYKKVKVILREKCSAPTVTKTAITY